MAGIKPPEAVETGIAFPIRVYRKQLVGEASRPHYAFELIADHLFAGVAIKLSGEHAEPVRETFEFESVGHVFTVQVRPIEASAHDA